jgi:uncharacterized protein YecE (DUF72 family)
MDGNDSALCVSDHHDAPSLWIGTASYVYVRGHEPGGRYRGRYRPNTLEALAGGDAAGRTKGVCLFHNDQKSAAAKDAAQLQSCCKPPQRRAAASTIVQSRGTAARRRDCFDSTRGASSCLKPPLTC